MRRVAAEAMLCGLAFAMSANAETVVVKGELSFSSTGIGKISECDSGREFTLGE